MTEVMPPRDNEAQDAVRRYLAILLKRKWFVIAVTILVVAAVSAWTFTRKKIYAGSATLLFDKRAPQVLGKDMREVVDMSMGNAWRSKEYLETQRRVLLSETLARKVIKRSGLMDEPAFWPKGPAAPTHDLENAITILLGGLQIESVKGADILRVRVRHENPQLAARLANEVTKTYIAQNIEYKASSGVHAVKWLADQLDDLKKKLESSELALYQFRRKHQIVSISFEDRQSLLSRRIMKIDETLTDLKTKRLILAAERREAKKAAGRDPMTVSLPKVVNSLTFPTLKDVFKRQRMRYHALLERYGEKHPLVKQQHMRFDSSLADLKRELSTIIDSYEVEYRQLRGAEQTLAATLETAKKESLDLNKKELVYNRLKRRQVNTAKLYGAILSRLRETDLSSQLRVSNMRLLDRAVPSLIPVSPRVRLNLIVGVFLGLLLGIGLAILLELLDTSIKSQEDLFGKFAFLGVVPRIPGAVVKRRGKRPPPNPEFDLSLHKNPKSSYAEAWRSVRTNLLFSSPDQKLHTLMVTSPSPREGKTTTAVSLAIAMSQSGSRVLLVDTDMRRPRLHRIFGVPGGDGLTSLLVGDKEIEDVLKTTEVPNLQLLPCGPTPPNPAEVCQSDRFKEVLESLGQRFDQVILDSPPVMAVTDAVVLSTLVQGVIVIARTGTTSRDAFSETMRQLNDVGAPRVACVLNDMDLDHTGYGYRRYGYYRRGYGYGYGRYGYGHYGDDEEPAKS